MSEPARASLPAKPRGGPDFHKPGCKCNACVARRRSAEAIANGAGPATLDNAPQTPDVIISDLPVAKHGVERKRIAMWLQWKAIEPSLSHKEAGARMGIAPQTLTNLIYKATKEGWLKFTDPINTLRYESMPKVVHNLNYYLDQGDKQVTIEVAKGTLFKKFLAEEGVQDNPTNILAIKFEQAPQSPTVDGKVVTGKIVGKPRSIEAFIDVTEQD